MTDLSSYTAVFRGRANPDDGRRVSKRNRQPLSCSACRLRKLKCDRQRPCGSCAKGGDGASCDLVSRGNSAMPRRNETSKSEAHVRLRGLEQMVHGFLQSSMIGPPTGMPGDMALNVELQDLADYTPLQNTGASTGGHLSRQGTETSYVGATHWEAILESIHDIQYYFESDHETSPSLSSQAESKNSLDVVLGHLEPLTLADVLAALPLRSTVNKLLSVYFNAKFIMVPFIHSAKFQRECEAFWDNPSSVPFLWLSILFSTLCLASTVAAATGKDVGLQQVSCNPVAYLTKAGRCLVTGQYLKAQPNSVEALVLYSHCKYILNRDSDPILWAMYGLATRLAQRMGYHRDPRHLSTNISPFDGEMRRRVWFFIETFDVLLSFQLGMPAILHEDECDTEYPSNLPDEDFDQSSQTLPAPRANTDPTPILYYCCKARLIRLLRRVIRHVLSTKQLTYN